MSPEALGTVLRGVGVAPGIVLGAASRMDHAPVPVEHVHLPPSLLDAEVARLRDAVERAEQAIDTLHQSLAEAGGSHGEHYGVLDAHKMMLRDHMLLDESERRIRELGINAEWAVTDTLDHITDVFSNLEDPFFRERGSDVQHVGDLLLRTLRGDDAYQQAIDDVPRGAIVVASGLSPAEALTLARRPVSGFALDHGTATSHTAIVARSMGIPAVVGLVDASERVGDGDRVILDGGEGEVILHPSPEEELVYARRERRAKAFSRALRQNRDKPAITEDGSEVTLRGNLDFAADSQRIAEFGGWGVGLFRTEYLFLDRVVLPTEDEQLDIYTRILKESAPHQVDIRTLDLGGDKQLSVERAGVVVSPGLRAIRYCFRDRALFDSQLRALLRASVHGSLRILIPFVTNMGEVQRVKRIVAEITETLRAEGHRVAEHVPVGFMVEVPGAALIADALSAEADFLSVGTNDLIQYTLAISRDDEAVSGLYQPLHPGVLKLMQATTRAALAADIDVSICGEMAGDPRYALILIALGFTALSMNATSIPMVKEVIRRCTREEADQLLAQVMSLGSADEISDRVDSYMVERFPDIVRPRMRQAPRFAR